MSGDVDWSQLHLLLGRRFATDFTIRWIGPPRRRGDVGTVGIEMAGRLYTLNLAELRVLLDAGFIHEVTTGAKETPEGDST